MSDQEELTFSAGAPDELATPEQPLTSASAPSEEMPEGRLKKMIDGNFIRYASYVIRDRAIPEIDDGLKPVQRRILHSLFENDDGKFIKVANIAGYCMQFHPHGNVSIEDALVSIASKQFLIEGQGNFGNIYTGDPAAASRYIECRLTDMARSEIFNYEITDMVPSYDGRKEEPVTLPAKIPLLLMLGTSGIAVGISTRVLPHNLKELIEAQIAIVNKQMFVVYPDFPQGGIMDASTYDNGRGQVSVRAVIEKKDEHTLVIRQIPYGTTTDTLIASIEDAAKKGKIKISAINDFTAELVEIEIVLQQEEDPDRAIKALYAFSLCQLQISSNIVVIKDNKPVEMTVEEILRYNTTRLTYILRKELLLEQKQLKEELHKKTLVQIFIGHRIYKLLEECKTTEEMDTVLRGALASYRENLQHDITVKDIEMLLNIPIRRISQFDLNKNNQEIAVILEGLCDVEKKLSSISQHTIRYLRSLLNKYGDVFPRKTTIARFEDVAVREITATELAVSYERNKGYLGYSVKGEQLLQCSSFDKLLIVWEDGRYKLMPPPDKLFVDTSVIYCAVAERDREFVIVYTESPFIYAKKFTTGGMIMNKEYRCIPKESAIIMIADDVPETLYVKYTPAPDIKIRQQEFDLSKLPRRDPKSNGIMLTSKTIESVASKQPQDWNKELNGPRGTFINI